LSYLIFDVLYVDDGFVVEFLVVDSAS